MTRLVCAVALLTAMAGAGCGSGIRPPDEYTGCATDEHWHRFDDVESDHQVVVDDTQAATITSPLPSTQAGTISATPTPRFTWEPQPFDAGSSTGNVVYMNGPDCDNCCPEFNLGALSSAHLPPISGNVYDLQFSENGKVTHRVLSTLQEWQPHDALWASWDGKSISLAIVKLAVISNDQRGPAYTAAQPYVFTVASP